MKIKRTILLCGLVAALLPTAAQAQTQLVDCNCLAKLHELQTNACQGVIPDLCALASQCLLTPAVPQCSQTPAPGGSVGPGSYPITVTFTDFSTGQALTQTCNVQFTVTIPPGGCGTNGCIQPPTGMLGWWPLDEPCGSFVFADVSGNGNAAIVETGASCSPFSPNAVTGKVLGANYFYTFAARGRAPSPSLNVGTNSFSADCWVNPVLTGPTAWHPILDKLQQTGAGTGFGYKVGLLNQRVVLVVGSGNLYTNTSIGLINYGP